MQYNTFFWKHVSYYLIETITMEIKLLIQKYKLKFQN